LAVFNPTLHKIVPTDASNYRQGPILSQVNPDGIEQTMAFASRLLSTAERKYATVEKDVLAWFRGGVHIGGAGISLNIQIIRH